MLPIPSVIVRWSLVPTRLSVGIPYWMAAAGYRTNC